MRKIMSLAIALLILAGVVITPESTYAYEYTGGTNSGSSSITISWDPNGAWKEDLEFTNDSSIFTVNSPSANDKYVVGQAILLSVTPHKYSNYIFPGGISSNLADNFVMTILKGDSIKKEFEFSYKSSDVGETFTDSFTPTEEGTYKINIFFRGSTARGSNFGNYYIQVVKAANTNASSVIKTKDGTYTIQNGSAALKTPKNNTITKLAIPDTIKANGKTVPVTAIAKNAFKGMDKLTTVTIGKNVKSIGAKAFYGCKKLKKITIKSTKLTKKTIGSKAFTGINKKAVIKCPKGKKAAYKKILLKKGMKKTMKFK